MSSVHTALIKSREIVSSLPTPVTEADFMKILKKHGVVFFGPRCSDVLASDLFLVGIEDRVSIEELLAELPEACKDLGMALDPMIKLADSRKKNPPITNYIIHLL